ncbi:hypothetical protein TIFTF001_035190 [Ficus carica]|uniref:Uncharacterized protein n=1 Tax=Ficus carica TaxID=3494 RepID=A0AA88E540_FICCA|nr:hypothetical protein TIFTF001_035182 [Ficus carica]GMN66122.1 hypothetical protein TIFTF001_035190 [Ficus carica]
MTWAPVPPCPGYSVGSASTEVTRPVNEVLVEETGIVGSNLVGSIRPMLRKSGLDILAQPVTPRKGIPS